MAIRLVDIFPQAVRDLVDGRGQVECDDGDACNGEEVCDPAGGGWVPGERVVCALPGQVADPVDSGCNRTLVNTGGTWTLKPV